MPPLDLNAPASIASGSPQGTMPLAVTTSASQLALHDSSDDSSDDSTGEEASERTRGSGPGGVAGGASVASTGRGEKVAPKKQRSVVYSVSGVTRAEDGTVFR